MLTISVTQATPRGGCQIVAHMERVVVVETTSLAWKARVIPLYDTRTKKTDRKKTKLTLEKLLRRTTILY